MEENLIKITLGTRKMSNKIFGVYFSIIKKIRRIDRTSHLIKLVVDYHTEQGNFVKV